MRYVILYNLHERRFLMGKFYLKDDYCGHCHKKLPPNRRGLWKYYCNQKCLIAAKKSFREAIIELCKDKNVCIVTLKGKA